MVWWQCWTYQDCNTSSIHELRIRDLLGLPNALVGRVADTLHGPFTLESNQVANVGCPKPKKRGIFESIGQLQTVNYTFEICRMIY